jgi:hypothetical protein
VEPALSDTDPEAARVHLDLLRRAPPERRLGLAFSLSRTVMSLTRGGLQRARPDATSQELDIEFVARLYGPQLAAEVRSDLAVRRRR